MTQYVCNCSFIDSDKTVSHFRVVRTNEEGECIYCGYYAVIKQENDNEENE